MCERETEREWERETRQSVFVPLVSLHNLLPNQIRFHWRPDLLRHSIISNIWRCPPAQPRLQQHVSTRRVFPTGYSWHAKIGRQSRQATRPKKAATTANEGATKPNEEATKPNEGATKLNADALLSLVLLLPFSVLLLLSVPKKEYYRSFTRWQCCAVQKHMFFLESPSVPEILSSHAIFVVVLPRVMWNRESTPMGLPDGIIMGSQLSIQCKIIMAHTYIATDFASVNEHIRAYFNVGLSHEAIVTFLRVHHGFHQSLRTLRRKLRELGLERQKHIHGESSEPPICKIKVLKKSTTNLFLLAKCDFQSTYLHLLPSVNQRFKIQHKTSHRDHRPSHHCW